MAEVVENVVDQSTQDAIKNMMAVLQSAGTNYSPSQVMQIVANGATQAFNVVKETAYGGNGEAYDFLRVVKDVGVGGAAVWEGTKYALTGMSLPTLSYLAVPALGVAGGQLLYDAAPEFWNARAEELMAVGEWIGEGVDWLAGKVVSLFDGETAETITSENVWNNIRLNLLNVPIFSEPSNTTISGYFGGTGNSFVYYLNFNIAKYIMGYGVTVSYKDSYGDTMEHTSNGIYVNVALLKDSGGYGSGGFFFNPIPSYTSNLEYNIKITKSNGTVSYSTYNAGTMVYINGNRYWYSVAGNVKTYQSTVVPVVNTLTSTEVSSYTKSGVANIQSIAIVNYILRKKTLDFSEGVTKPNTEESFTANYPNWKQVALDGVGGGLTTGVAIGTDVLGRPDLLSGGRDPVQEQIDAQSGAGILNPTNLGRLGEDAWEKMKEMIESLTKTKTGELADTDVWTDTNVGTGAIDQAIPDTKADVISPAIPANPNPTPTPGGIPILPTIPSSTASNKMFTVYNPSVSQLNALGGFLWNLFSGTDPVEAILTAFKKLWQSPLDGIIGLMKIYAPVPSGGSSNIMLGAIDSGVSAPVVSSQFSQLSIGGLKVNEVLHNVTDYSPYCSMHLYLPFIGFVEVDGDDIMDGTISVDYKFDLYTGTCLATVYVSRTPDMPSKTPLYTFSGSAAQQLPLTSASANGLLSGLVSATGAMLAGASGGSLIPLAANMIGHSMVHVNRSGSITANAGILASKTPALVVSRRNSYDANAYNTMYGFPANTTVYLGNCSGFTRVKDVHLKSYATEAEKEEIKSLLKKGVHF